MRGATATRIKIFGSLLIVLATEYDVSNAQQPSQIPRPELSMPGVSQKSSTRFPTVSSSAYADFSNAKARSTQFKDEVVSRTRSLQDISLFHQAAPSVVLILVKDALGSGSLLSNNIILTNLHVVDHNREVTVVFKPADPGGKPSQDEVVKGDVIKIDAQRDLALVRPRSLPNRPVTPLK
jgi:S1-C subfamily serine protease